jgi:hypothetical protein
MPEFKPSSRARNLLEHQWGHGRSYPTTHYWDRLYQMLQEEAEKRGKTPPPAPLTHGLDHEPTEAEKMERLQDQVTWADRNNLLHRIQMFFDGMPASGWNRSKR